MRTRTETLIAALHVLARDIESNDGVANAAIHEAAVRMNELDREVKRLRARQAPLNGTINKLRERIKKMEEAT